MASKASSGMERAQADYPSRAAKMDMVKKSSQMQIVQQMDSQAYTHNKETSDFFIYCCFYTNDSLNRKI